MKNTLKLIISFLLSSLLFLQTFAIDSPNNLKMDSVDNNTVNLSWDLVENAYMYYVYYGKSSGMKDGYTDTTDLTEESNISVSNLDLGTTYYFSVVSLDENGEESVYSNELTVDILSNDGEGSSDGNFSLDSVEVLKYNKVELTFSNPLDNSENAERKFKIRNKKDNLDVFDIVDTKINEKNDSKLELTLARDLDMGSEYEVVIITIFDKNGKNIESGIDNMETFIVPEIVEVEESMNSAQEEGPTGTDVESSEIENTTLGVAEENKNLPQTGPEHVLIFFLSIILGTLVFIFRFRKSQ